MTPVTELHSIDHPSVVSALRDRFGHEAFRGRQADAVQAVLEGRDVFLTMPTGMGKSLVYQLPAVGGKGPRLIRIEPSDGADLLGIESIRIRVQK